MYSGYFTSVITFNSHNTLHEILLLLIFTCQGTQGSGTLSHLPKVKQPVQVKSRGLNLRSIRLHSPNLCDTQLHLGKYGSPHRITSSHVIFGEKVSSHKDFFVRTEQGDISHVKNDVSSHLPCSPFLLRSEKVVGSNSTVVPTSCTEGNGWYCPRLGGKNDTLHWKTASGLKKPALLYYKMKLVRRIPNIRLFTVKRVPHTGRDYGDSSPVC